MTDINTTIEMLQIASDRLSWYVGLSIVATSISLCAVAWSIYHSREQLKASTKAHEESLAAQKAQLDANHDWNRRSFTSAQIKDFVTKLSSIRDELDILTTPTKTTECVNGENIEIISNEIIEHEGKFINFTDRLLLNKVLTSDEVHKWVCKPNSAHPSGYEKTAKGDNTSCKTVHNGEIIVNNLLEFISIYEQIAVGLLNKVFDEKIISDTLKNPIKKNYEFYKEYIEHRQTKHQAKNFGESFRQMYIKFWGETLTGDNRNKTEG